MFHRENKSCKVELSRKYNSVNYSAHVMKQDHHQHGRKSIIHCSKMDLLNITVEKEEDIDEARMSMHKL